MGTLQITFPVMSSQFVRIPEGQEMETGEEEGVMAVGAVGGGVESQVRGSGSQVVEGLGKRMDWWGPCPFNMTRPQKA